MRLYLKITQLLLEKAPASQICLTLIILITAISSITTTTITITTTIQMKMIWVSLKGDKGLTIK